MQQEGRDLGGIPKVNEQQTLLANHHELREVCKTESHSQSPWGANPMDTLMADFEPPEP